MALPMEMAMKCLERQLELNVRADFGNYEGGLIIRKLAGIIMIRRILHTP
jgi:hypothetical protein